LLNEYTKDLELQLSYVGVKNIKEFYIREYSIKSKSLSKWDDIIVLIESIKKLKEK
jgi:hypothetical protein